jgi:dTDP-4-dehydrorhamnose reductase
MSKKVLVTGATGLLGPYVVRALEGRGFQVRAVGSRDGDLTHSASARKLLDEAAPSVVVNLAGLTNVDQCEREPGKAYALNCAVAENLAAWANEKSAYLLHVSTDQVYDKRPVGGVTSAEAELNVLNVYALSKRAGELAAERAPGAGILRTNFFGKSLTPGRTSFTDWLFGAAKSGEEFSLLEDVWFNPLSLPRLSAVLSRFAEERIPGTYNVGSREGLSKAAFGEAFLGAAGLKAKYRVRSADGFFTVPRPKNMMMNCERAEKALGLTFPNLKEDLCEIAKEYP